MQIVVSGNVGLLFSYIQTNKITANNILLSIDMNVQSNTMVLIISV